MLPLSLTPPHLLFLNSLPNPSYQPISLAEDSVLHTFVTLVPARKNTINKAKGRLHGCTACATAVSTAATIPAGVSDWCLYARTTMAAVTGTHIIAFMAFTAGYYITTELEGLCCLAKETAVFLVLRFHVRRNLVPAWLVISGMMRSLLGITQLCVQR